MILKYLAKSKLTFVLVLLCANLTLAQNNEVVVDKIISKVDNYIILKSELERAYLSLLSQGQASGDQDKCTVLENLIISKLLAAKAEIDSIVVDDQMVDRQLDAKLQYMIQQIGSEEKIEEYYGKTLNEFKDELREQEKEQLTAQKMQQTIIDEVSITPAEVKKFFKAIPKDSLPYFSKEVSVAQIVKIPKVSKKEEERAKDILMQIRGQILDKGADFEEMAKKYSMGPSAKYGGNLGFTGRGKMVPEYEAAAMKLKDGEISLPIKTEFGYHLVQLIERRGNEYNSRHILVIPQFSDEDFAKAGHYLDSLANLIKLDSITFEKAAKEYSDDKQTKGSGGFILSSDGSKYIQVSELDPNLFFTIDTMKVGAISKPMKFTGADGKEAMRIIYFENIKKAHQANLEEDYQKIQSAALNAKKAKIMNDWFEDAREEVYIEIDRDYDYCKIKVQ